MKRFTQFNWLISALLMAQGGNAFAQSKKPRLDDIYGENSAILFSKQYIPSPTPQPRTLQEKYTAMQIYLARGQAKASNVIRLEFGGTLPLKESEMSHYDQLERITSFEWKTLPPDRIGQYEVQGYKSANGDISIDPQLSGMKNNFLWRLILTSGHEVIHMLEAKSAILLPDKLMPRAGDVLEKVYGLEMNAVLSMGETPGQRAERIKLASDCHRIDGELPTGCVLSREHLLTTFNTMMAGAKESNGRVPKTRMEFYRAMDLAKYQLPDSIKNELANTEEGRAATRRFPKRMGVMFWLGINEYVHRVNQLSDPQKELFYRTVVPSVAGSVLNLNGALNGGKMVGLDSPDPEGARRFVDALSKDWPRQNRHSPLAMTAEQWKKMAEGVDPEYAGQVYMLALKQPLSDTKAPDAILGAYPAQIKAYLRDKIALPEKQAPVPEELLMQKKEAARLFLMIDPNQFFTVGRRESLTRDRTGLDFFNVPQPVMVRRR